MGTKVQKQIEQQRNGKVLTEQLIFVLVSILIIGAPLFRGLFFQKEIMISNIFAFAIFTAFLLSKRKRKEKLTVFNSPYDYIGLMFIVAYVLPIITFQWASLRDSIDILIRYTNYYALYLMVKDLVQDEKYRGYFTKVLILGSFIVAMIGILGATGYIKLDDVIMGNRISSTFQYPNTLAALMMSMVFLVNGCIHQSERYIEKLIYGIIGFIMLFTFIFTYSRAAWLLFPIFALLYLVFLPSKERIGSILYFIAALVPNVLVLQPFTSQLAIGAETKPRALTVFVIGVGIFTVLYSIVIFIQFKLQEKYYKAIYGLLGVAVVAAGVFAYLALNTTEPLVLSNMDGTENRTNQIQRTINGVEENKDYILRIDVDGEAQSENEKHWPWRIRVNSVNEAGEQEVLLEHLGEKDMNGEIEIPFTTLDTTKNLNIYFTNTYPKTEVTFNTAEVLEAEGNPVQNIQLKYKYIPESLIARFNSIDLKDDNASGGRLTFYKDSFSIFKAKPLFGGGGGTWEALYSKYQSLSYNSTEAHNYILQTLVETGTIGMAVLGLLILALVVQLIKTWRIKDSLTVSILFAILALLGHSVLDFNFSFHSIPMLFWVLVALLENETFENIKLKVKGIDFTGKKLGALVPAILSVFLLVFSTSLYSAYAIAERNIKIINDIPLEESIGKMEKAVMLDPYHPNMRIDLGKMLRKQGLEANDFSLVQKAENHFKKAVKNSPYMPVVLSETASYYISIGQFEEAFKYLDRSTKATPLKQYGYETKSEAYKAVANYYLSKGDIDNAVDIYENNMLGIIDEVREANSKTEKTITLTQDTLQNIFKAKYFIDNQDNPEKLAELEDIVYVSYLDLEGAMGIDEPWRKWDAEGGKIRMEVSEEGLKVYNDGENYGFVYSQYFTLNPSTTYEVEVIFSKKGTQETFTSYIISESGDRIQTSEDVNLKEISNEIYRYEFATTENIEPGGQYIRFDHTGKNKDHFAIRQIVIREAK